MPDRNNTNKNERWEESVKMGNNWDESFQIEAGNELFTFNSNPS